MDVDLAVTAAYDAFPKWSKSSPAQRQMLLRTIADKLRARQLEYAMMESLNNGKTITDYSIDELKKQAALMRGYTLTALCAAGSGHAGGSLSIMDVTAALYLRCADHDWAGMVGDITVAARVARPPGRRSARCWASIGW